MPGLLSLSLKCIATLLQRRGDLPDLIRRMDAGEWRSDIQVFAHRQTTDRDRLKADLLDQPRSDRHRVWVVAGDRYPDRIALSVRQLGQLRIADPVKRAHQMPTEQQ